MGSGYRGVGLWWVEGRRSASPMPTHDDRTVMNGAPGSVAAGVGRLGFGGFGIGVAAGVDGRRFWIGVAAGVRGGVGVSGGVVHLAQHGGASGAEEADEEKRAEGEEEEVEDGGVVPGDGGVHDRKLMVGGDEMQGGEESFDNEGGPGHGDVEGDGEEGGD